MTRIEKTVFISYRRIDSPWALSIYQWLTQHGYDVFIDYEGIASGSFEAVIIENILARAHFLVLLSETALDRCGEKGDWLRREIEEALAAKRNVVPIFLPAFDFNAAQLAKLTGGLVPLPQYNGLAIDPSSFAEKMERLSSRFLNIGLDAVLHPASVRALRAAKEQKSAADAAMADAADLQIVNKEFGRLVELAEAQHRLSTSRAPTKPPSVRQSTIGPRVPLDLKEWRRQRIQAEDMITPDEAAQLAGTSRITVHSWIGKGRAIGLAQDKRGVRLPRWQFETKLWSVLPELARALRTTEGWALLAFLESPQGELGGITPRQAIEQGEVPRVIEQAILEGKRIEQRRRQTSRTDAKVVTRRKGHA